ncbi:MAG: hypothetical protein JWM06_2300 [Actinomycetia bacterium]|nr:hypothetical protein [Actinomycetes bacterium]
MSARREAKAAVRRDGRADLEHDLVAVAQPQASRVETAADAVHVQADTATESQEPRGTERTAPDREEVAERRSALEGDDAGRIRRPERRATTGVGDAAERNALTAQPDRGGDDHDAAAGEELHVHARAAVYRRRNARAVRSRLRVVARADADRRRHERKSRGHQKHRRHAIPLVVLVALLAGCGGSSGAKQGGGITVQPARTYRLEPLRVVHPAAGKPATLSFRIVQPDGTPLTDYRHGAGPHTGVHLIFVRRDLSTIVHRHPPIRPDGSFTEPIAFPSPGPYRIVVDAYPQHAAQTNFQLFSTIDVAGGYRPQPLPPLRRTETVGGYRFVLHGTPHMRAIEPAFLRFTVTRPDGTPASFTPWYGALAHAIFFRKGSLDYFHTHVCAPGASGCTSALGTAKVTGTSASPGTLNVGVLVPLPGTWRLFLQCRVDGRVITAPFTLVVT